MADTPAPVASPAVQVYHRKINSIRHDFHAKAAGILAQADQKRIAALHAKIQENL